MVGSFCVSIWTVVRFFDQKFIMDLVGQQVTAQQWLNGHIGSVMLGQTNYLLKLIFVYIPFYLLPLTPWLRLLSMTLLINIATFALLVLVIKKLWQEFYPKTDWSFYLPLMWLSVLAGSMYWVQFANSRNLEIVGGVYLIYLCIIIVKHPTIWRYAGLAALAGVVLFADPLQLYMSLLPALLYATFTWWRHVKTDGRRLLWLAVAAVMGYGLAQSLFWLTARIWHVSYVVTSSQPLQGSLVDFALNSFTNAVNELAHLFVGGIELGEPVEALNLGLVAGIFVLAAYHLWRGTLSRRLAALCSIVWLVDLGVYIASGQALRAQTNRYILVTVPFFILLMIATLHATKAYRRQILLVVAGVVTINIFALGIALRTHWDPALSNEKHARAASTYLQTHGYSYAYGSLDTALTADYLANDSTIIPVGCDAASKLFEANLFFNRTAIDALRANPQAEVPLILDANASITNFPATCNTDAIKISLGNWDKIDYLSDGSTVLLYNSAQINRTLLTTRR